MCIRDRAYTYNKRVNHLPPVAQHYMLRKALSKGLTEQRLADALDVKIDAIRRTTTMLDGICPEVIDILREKDLLASGFGILRKMKPFRQIEAAEHLSLIHISRSQSVCWKTGCWNALQRDECSPNPANCLGFSPRN